MVAAVWVSGDTWGASVGIDSTEAACAGYANEDRGSCAETRPEENRNSASTRHHVRRIAAPPYLRSRAGMAEWKRAALPGRSPIGSIGTIGRVLHRVFQAAARAVSNCAMGPLRMSSSWSRGRDRGSIVQAMVVHDAHRDRAIGGDEAIVQGRRQGSNRVQRLGPQRGVDRHAESARYLTRRRPDACKAIHQSQRRRSFGNRATNRLLRKCGIESRGRVRQSSRVLCKSLSEVSSGWRRRRLRMTFSP